jgi:hypothetical protein
MIRSLIHLAKARFDRLLRIDEIGANPKILFDRHLREDPAPFGNAGNPETDDLVGRHLIERLAFESDRAGARRRQSQD